MMKGTGDKEAKRQKRGNERRNRNAIRRVERTRPDTRLIPVADGWAE